MDLEPRKALSDRRGAAVLSDNEILMSEGFDRNMDRPIGLFIFVNVVHAHHYGLGQFIKV